MERKLINTKKMKSSALSDVYLKYGSWASIFGISWSLGNDLHEAHGVYDALRKVNSNFSELTDREIWWETLWMSPESLAGLANLAKGAYFEQLVADDTGGELFEHFNHKDTDIVIDGVEVQLKATDSVSYVNSVDSNITVMATSEVADKTDAIDSGISNSDLTNTTDLALGGSVVDAGDATIDGLLTGVGCVGLMASVKGLNHGLKEYKEHSDFADAALEGTGVAIEQTLESTCNLIEIIFNLVDKLLSKLSN